MPLCPNPTVEYAPSIRPPLSKPLPNIQNLAPSVQVISTRLHFIQHRCHGLCFCFLLRIEIQRADPAENAIQANTESRDQLQAARTEIVRKYESTVLDWIRSADKASADEKSSLETVRGLRDALADDLKKNYWELDPYLRARSYYDRTGVISRDGSLNFYPKEKPKTEAVAPVLNKVETSPDDLD